jgi:hypothetical protein
MYINLNVSIFTFFIGRRCLWPAYKSLIAAQSNSKVTQTAFLLEPTMYSSQRSPVRFSPACSLCAPNARRMAHIFVSTGGNYALFGDSASVKTSAKVRKEPGSSPGGSWDLLLHREAKKSVLTTCRASVLLSSAKSTVRARHRGKVMTAPCALV